jgi:hypothetical protein
MPRAARASRAAARSDDDIAASGRFDIKPVFEKNRTDLSVNNRTVLGSKGMKP